VRKIAGGASGFLYCISVTGVTGTSRPDLSRVQRDAGRIRRVSSLPLAVGFGISTPEQVREIAPWVDGVVVGSAVVRLVAEHADGPRMVDRVCDLATRLKDATRSVSTL
jgi:tryptophan synthase alpha chain